MQHGPQCAWRRKQEVGPVHLELHTVGRLPKFIAMLLQNYFYLNGTVPPIPATQRPCFDTIDSGGNVVGDSVEEISSGINIAAHTCFTLHHCFSKFVLPPSTLRALRVTGQGTGDQRALDGRARAHEFDPGRGGRGLRRRGPRLPAGTAKPRNPRHFDGT